MLSAFGLLLAAQLFASPPALRSVADVDAFFNDPTASDTPFRIQGVLQQKRPQVTKRFTFVLRDAHGRRLLFAYPRGDALQVGDEVVISGIAERGDDREPFLTVTNDVRVGSGEVDRPLKLALRDIDERRHDLCEIETSGAVVDVRNDEIDAAFKYLILQDGSVTLPVFATNDKFEDGRPLLGATVRISGLFVRTLPSGRKFGGPLVNLETLDVVVPPPTDPFDAPQLNTSYYQTPRDLARAGRRTVRGRVLASWAGAWFLLRTADGYFVGVETAADAPLPPFGAAVTASGFPETDRFHLLLTRALCRVDATGGTPPDEPPEVHSIDDIMPVGQSRRAFADVYGKLAALDGILRSVSTPDDPNRRAYVECGGVLLPVDFSSAPTAFAKANVGYGVRVTGRCILQVENRTPTYAYPPLKDFTLVLRRPGDVAVLTPWRWWTPGRLMVVIGALLAGLAALYVRNRILKRFGRLKVAERTRLAVELHDSLSQSLAGLACQIAATEDAANDNPAAVKGKLATAVRMLKSCRTELRQCLFDLRSDTLDEPDFARAVRRTVEHLTPYAGITVRFNVRRARLGDSVAHATLAIVRELVTNAVRHGNAATVKVAGTIDGERLRFSVRDDGQGFDPSRCDGVAQGHFGLNGIRERVKPLGGTFEIRSAAGKGTRAAVAIPIRPT